MADPRVEKIRDGFSYPPDEHHHRCSSRIDDHGTGGKCDCYGRVSNEAHVALDSLVAERETTREAQRLVSAYYDYHSSGGEICPCDVCEKARPYFAALLRGSGGTP